MLIRLIFISIIQVIIVSACNEPLKRICYYTSWGGVFPNPANLCTHVIYSFANMEGGILSGVWSNPLKELRKQSSDIKLMVAVGGWTFGKKNNFTYYCGSLSFDLRCCKND
jgi:GH18 family chitinase